MNAKLETVHSNSLLLVRDQAEFDKKLREMTLDGPDKLHLLLDYDGTVTYEWDKDGNPRPSLIATLRHGNYLNEVYTQESQALASHYRTIERDPSVEPAVKNIMMQEWWEKHYALLIKHRLNRSDIDRAMRDAQLRIRPGMRRLLEMAAGASVPVVIMSANGLGSESIHWHLEHNNLNLPNIAVVSNELEWDKDGYMVGYRQPIIHSLNKTETVLTDLPVAEKIHGRTNIVQMGDSLSDVGMAAGIEGARVLSIGFYNRKSPDHLNHFLETFDAVLTDDSNAEEVADLTGRLLGNAT